MNERPTASSTFVVAGARPFSLGAALALELAIAVTDSKIIIIDIEPPTSSHPNIIAQQFDLNPLHHATGFEAWSTELTTLLSSVVRSVATQSPVRGVFLALGVYGVSAYESTKAAERADILGTNILGKFEILHAVMRLNADHGFDNATVLQLFDIGSLHALRHTSHRALYSSSKMAGLALCEVLVAGSEVRRAIHVAPSNIDTPMLHWNHWCLKENGDPKLPNLVRLRLPALYPRVFRNCDVTAFATALLELGFGNPGIQTVFERYKHRRKMVSETEDGITSPETLAAYLVSLVLEEENIESGVIEVTSPNGRMKTVRKAF